MKLADWLYDNNRTPSWLRERLGGVARSTVQRYLVGRRIPKPGTLQRIIDLTGGAVQLEDFLDPSPPECAVLIRTQQGEEEHVLPWSPKLLTVHRGAVEPDESLARISDPVKQALFVLGGRARFTRRGVFLLDGRTVSLKRLMAEANKVLRSRGERPIPYPGVESIHE